MGAARAEFEELGVRLVVIAPGTTGVQAFIDAAWEGGEIFVDEGAEFKKAMWESDKGGGKVSNLWLAKPKVIAKMLKVAKLYGHEEDDIKLPTAPLLGGELLLGRRDTAGDDGVLFEFHENSELGHASVETLLAEARKAAAAAAAVAAPTAANAAAVAGQSA